MPRSYGAPESFRITEEQYVELKKLVEYGEFSSVSDAVRTAIGDFIEKRVGLLEARLLLIEKYGKKE